MEARLISRLQRMPRLVDQEQRRARDERQQDRSDDQMMRPSSPSARLPPVDMVAAGQAARRRAGRPGTAPSWQSR